MPIVIAAALMFSLATGLQERPDFAAQLEQARLDLALVQAANGVRLLAGDLIGFDRDLVHRSNRNRSPRPRVTAVVQFAVIDRIPESMQLPY